MAITVKHQPTGTTYLPAYNDNIFISTEGDSSKYNGYNYKFNTRVKDSSNVVINMLKVPIHYGSTNKGVFNISKVIQGYVSHDWNYTDSAASGCPNSIFEYNIDFGYEYATGATDVPILSTGDVSLTGKKIWNAALSPEDFINYDEDDYLMGAGSSAKFLTNRTSKKIYNDQKDWLYALNNGDLDHLYVDFSGGGSTTITSPTSDIVRFPIGANIPGGIPTGVTSYTIEPRDSSSGSVGSSFTINLDDRCSKYETVDLFFLNRLGGVESFRFNMIRRDNFSINRKSYRANPYTLDNSAITYTYDNQSHNKTDFYTDSVQRTTLNSNLISEVEAVWLRELIMSPRVWMYDGSLKAINIATSEYEQRYHVNDKVFNLTLEVEHTFADKSQRI